MIGASGGGLAAGISLAVKARAPDAKIYTAEPEGFDDTARSFRSGKREHNARLTGTICDALMSNTPGKITFAINRELIGEGDHGERRGSRRARSPSRSASSSWWSSPAAPSALRRCWPDGST